MYLQDLEMLKEIPGYKAILKAVLKSQIQMLVEQLSCQTEEESIILTASLSDGTFCHLGSSSGKNFLDGREEIKSQFLFHCLKSKTNSTDTNEEENFLPVETVQPHFVVSPQDKRPAKKPRRSLPLLPFARGIGLSRGGPSSRGSPGRGRGSSGRGRKLPRQLVAGVSNLNRPHSDVTSTVTQPVFSRPVSSASSTITQSITESSTIEHTEPGTDNHPLAEVITVKTEKFELDTDLNAKSVKSKEVPVDDSFAGDMDNTSQLQESIDATAVSTQSSVGIESGMNISVGELKNAAGDATTNINDNLVTIKQEAPDDFEITGVEPGTSHDMYGVPGPSGDLGSQNWTPMDIQAMAAANLTSGAEGQSEESFDYGEQSTSKKKTTGRKRLQYNPEILAKAIKMVRSGKMGKREAAKTFGVPISTLYCKVTGISPEEITRPGPKTSLTPAEENDLVEYLNQMAEIGYTITQKDVGLEVKNVLDKAGRTSRLRDNYPGKDWYKCFANRHPDLMDRTPVYLKSITGPHAISSETIDSWYDGGMNLIQRQAEDWEDLIHDPRRIFCASSISFPVCDETGHVLSPTDGKILSTVSRHICIMTCFNASGNSTPPLVIGRGITIPESVTHNFPEAVFSHAEFGIIDDAFLRLMKHLVQFVNNEQIKFPIVLFVDPQTTHISMTSSKFCAENNVILYCWIPYLMDTCSNNFAAVMHMTWEESQKEQGVFLEDFPTLLKKIWMKVAVPVNITSGFRQSGLFPFEKFGTRKLAAVKSDGQ